MLRHFENRRAVEARAVDAHLDRRPAGNLSEHLVALRSDQDRVLRLGAGDRRVPGVGLSLCDLLDAVGRADVLARLVPGRATLVVELPLLAEAGRLVARHRARE